MWVLVKTIFADQESRNYIKLIMKITIKLILPYNFILQPILIYLRAVCIPRY